MRIELMFRKSTYTYNSIPVIIKKKKQKYTEKIIRKAKQIPAPKVFQRYIPVFPI